MSESKPSARNAWHPWRSRAHWAIAVTAVLFVVLWRRPYIGYQHDAALYLMFALERLTPGTFASDLLFTHGVQAQVTTFAGIQAWFVAIAGVSVAGWVMSALGLICFFVGVYACAAAVTTRALALWSAACVACLTRFYGGSWAGSGVLGIGEPFVTPRPIAEGLVLMALAALIRRRVSVAVCLLLSAMLVHPLMGFAGVGVALVSEAVIRTGDRILRWRVLALLTCLVALAVGAIVALSPRYDDQWWAWTVAANGWFALPGQWSWVSFVPVGIGCHLLLIASQRSPVLPKVVMRATIIVALLGLTSAWLIGEVGRVVWVVSGQPWRALWLLHAMSLIALPIAARVLWHSGGWARTGSICFAAAFVLPPEWSLMWWMLAATALGLQSRPFMLFRPSVALALTSASVAVLLVRDLYVNWLALRDVIQDPLMLGTAVLAQRGGPPLLILLTCWYAWKSYPNARAVIVGFIFVNALAVGAVLDRRGPWELRLESSVREESLAGAGTVWWEDSPSAATWLILRRPSYLDNAHLTNVLFDRAYAARVQERVAAVEPVLRRSRDCARQASGVACEEWQRALRNLCSHHDPPTFVVTRRPVASDSRRTELGGLPPFWSTSCNTVLGG